MMLSSLLLILFFAAILAWGLERVHPLLSRWISLIALLFDLVWVCGFWIANHHAIKLTGQHSWIAELDLVWIPQFGIRFHLAMDGLSLLLLTLTLFLGVLSVLASWREIHHHIGFFHFNLLAILTGIMGVFLAMDMILFYLFWEVMLIPMAFLIAIWGHENRTYAAYKFFIFTQASGLLMLVSILGFYFILGQSTLYYTFAYQDWLGTRLPPGLATPIMLGFLAAFLVKLSSVPLHSWLPDAHTQAPTAGSVILAGLLLKTGAYGLLRFVLPLFPKAAADLAWLMMILGVVSIVYGALLAFSQTDLKRLVAYTSVSHMGFVLVGVFSFSFLAQQGAILQILAHGLSTGALFILAGALQHRLHTRELADMGGFWKIAPRMGGVALFFALASLGLPGLGNFVAEFLILLGTFQITPWISVFASLGLIVAAVYSLRFVQQVFHGKPAIKEPLPDFNFREMLIMAFMIIGLLWLGLYPNPILDTGKGALQNIRQTTNAQIQDNPVGLIDRTISKQ